MESVNLAILLILPTDRHLIKKKRIKTKNLIKSFKNQILSFYLTQITVVSKYTFVLPLVFSANENLRIFSTGEVYLY